MTTVDNAPLEGPEPADSDDSRLHVVTGHLIAAAARIPGFRVNREKFLQKQLSVASIGHEVDVDLAIESNPIDAGVPIESLDKRADSIIRNHMVAATGASAVSGLPGGLLMAATIPADLAQFYWHSLVCAQELAYLYGWSDLFPDGELEMDEATEHRLILLLGALHGVEALNKTLSLGASQAAKGTAKYLPRTALAGSWYFPLTKKVAEQVGIKVTRQSFGRGVAKAIPVAGAVASGGITAISFRHMTNNLKEHLRTAALEPPPDISDDSGSGDS